MIKLTRCSPNTIGAYYTEEYDTYPEEYIEKLCERLANKGWKLSEIKGSTTKDGTIECTHDDRADIELIQWETIVEHNETEGDTCNHSDFTENGVCGDCGEVVERYRD